MSEHTCGEWSCFDCPHKIECDPVYEDEDTARCGLECPARTSERELLMVLEEAHELVADLRCYTHDWDWKYGDWWDEEITKLATAIQKGKG